MSQGEQIEKEQMTLSEAGRNLSRKATLNFLSFFINQGVVVFVRFWFTSAIIMSLGAAGYGLWVFIRRMAAIVQNLTLNPTSSLKLRLATLQHSEDALEKQRILGTVFFVLAITAPIYLVATGVLAIFLPTFMMEVPGLSISASVAFAVLCVGGFIQHIAWIPQSSLACHNQAFRGVWVISITTLGVGLLQITAVKLGAGLVVMACMEVAILLILGYLTCLIARRHLKWFGIKPSVAGERRRFLKLGFWMTIQQLSSQLIIAGDVLLIGFVMGAKSLALYNLTAIILRVLAQPLENLFRSSNAGFGYLVGAGDYKRIERLRIEMHSIGLFVLTILGCSYILLNRVFLKVWLHDDFFAGYSVCMGLLASHIFQRFYDLNLILTDFKLKVGNRALATLIGSVIGLLSGALTYSQFGMKGIAWSFAFANFLLFLYSQYLVNTLFQFSIRQYIASLLPQLLILVFTVIITTVLIAPEVKVESWIGLIAYSLLSLIAFTGIAALAIKPSLRTILLRRAVGIVKDGWK